MKPDVAQIMKQYPLTTEGYRLLSWKGKKGVWSIRTDLGGKILKKSPATGARLRFLCEAVGHLRRNGAPIPALVRTLNNSDFAELEGSCYTLSDAVEGRSPEYGSSSELRQIMRTLARFHLASRGFSGSGDGEERNHLGRWEEGYRTHLQNLAGFKEQASRRSDSFSKLYLKHADVFIQQGQEALKIVQGQAYRAWVSKVERQKNLCHQDFASGNLILGSKDLYVIDMDSLIFDLPARDLRKIINKVMKKSGWTADKAVVMLKAYQSVHPLSADEFGVLKADLLFPHLFCGISSKYFNERMESGWKERKAVEKLRAMIRSEMNKMNVLNRWDQVLRQVRGRWESDLFGRIISRYRHANPLSEKQLRLVRIDLMFPHLLHETAKNPFQNGSAVPKSKLLTAVRIEREKEEALSQWPAKK